MDAHQVKTADLSASRYSSLKNELRANKEYLESLKSGNPSQHGFSNTEKIEEIKKLEIDIKRKELYLKNAMEQTKLTDEQRDRTYKLHKELGQQIKDMITSHYQDRLNIKSQDRAGYWRALQHEMKLQTDPKYQKLVKEYRRCASLINPSDPTLRDLRILKKNKHVSD